MGIYYQPPQPHIGGRQPLEPPRLAPSITAVPVHDPPFSHGGRPGPEFWNIIRTWDALPPDPKRPGVYIVQPAAVPSGDNPPFGIPIRALWNILRAWEPTPAMPPKNKITAAFPGWSVDKPPPVNDAVFLNILRSWDALPPRLNGGEIYLVQPGAAPSGDNPPFGIPIRALWNILRAWDPDLPKPQSARMTVALPGWSVDNPPLSVFRRNVSILIRSWEAFPSVAQKSNRIILPAAAPSADDPPWGIRISLWTILAAWEPPPPMPTRTWPLIAQNIFVGLATYAASLIAMPRDLSLRAIRRGFAFRAIARFLRLIGAEKD